MFISIADIVRIARMQPLTHRADQDSRRRAGRVIGQPQEEEVNCRAKDGRQRGLETDRQERPNNTYRSRGSRKKRASGRLGDPMTLIGSKSELLAPHASDGGA